MEKIEMPTNIAESQLIKVLPKAYQRATDISHQLKSLYAPEVNLADQQFNWGGAQAKEIVERKLSSSKREEPEASWQGQWMTVFKVFYDLGASRAKGEGENGRGSDESRFAARCLQGHLIESDEPRLRIDGASSPREEQKRLLKNTARFALVAATVDKETDRPGSTQEPVLETFDRAFFARNEILEKVSRDKEEPEDRQKFSIRNV